MGLLLVPCYANIIADLLVQAHADIELTYCTIVEFSTSNFPGRLPLAIKAFLPTNVIFESSSLTITTWSF